MRADNVLDFSDENRADFDEILQKFRAQRARVGGLQDLRKDIFVAVERQA